MSSKTFDDDFSEITPSMYSMLNRSPISFPSGNDRSCTLEQLANDINSKSSNENPLPMIVKITSLNEYGRKIKTLVSKNSSLLLLRVCELDSVLAEYHRPCDGHQHAQRNRLVYTSGRFSSKTLRTVKKLSRSLVALNTTAPATNTNEDEHLPADEDEPDSYNQRNLKKIVSEKRSSVTPLCRIPAQYGNVFELLNENDQSTEPFHILSDLMTTEGSADDLTKSTPQWPHSFFLRSSCNAYTHKYSNENSNSTNDNQKLNLGGKLGSRLNTSFDLESKKNPVILNNDIRILPAGQILTVLNTCYATVDEPILERELSEAAGSISSSSSTTTTRSWRKKSKQFFSKFRRQSNDILSIPHEIVRSTSLPGKSEHFLKCQTQNGEIVYIFVHESGLFSALNHRADQLKANTEFNTFDIAGLFQLKDIISNFRFPLSVRLLNGFDLCDNLSSTAIIHRDEQKPLKPTKLRLLVPYKELVIFACPLHLSSTRYQKPSSPIVVIPISVDADIQIQPCINMSEVSKNEAFQKIVERCFQIIDDYQKEISLINVPLQPPTSKNHQKQMLSSKRSQSESHLDYFEAISSKNRYSNKSDDVYHNADDEPPSETMLLSCTTDLMEKLLDKPISDREQAQSSLVKLSDYRHKTCTDNVRKHSRDHLNAEDEMYQDVDKIYDYIRSGNITCDVQRIQAKEQGVPRSPIMDMTNMLNKATVPSPKFSGLKGSRQHSMELDEMLTVDRSKNDGNVDDDQARALFQASKQHSRDNIQDIGNSKSTSPVKRTK